MCLCYLATVFCLPFSSTNHSHFEFVACSTVVLCVFCFDVGSILGVSEPCSLNPNSTPLPLFEQNTHILRLCIFLMLPMSNMYTSCCTKP